MSIVEDSIKVKTKLYSGNTVMKNIYITGEKTLLVFLCLLLLDQYHDFGEGRGGKNIAKVHDNLKKAAKGTLEFIKKFTWNGSRVLCAYLGMPSNNKFKDLVISVINYMDNVKQKPNKYNMGVELLSYLDIGSQSFEDMHRMFSASEDIPYYDTYRCSELSNFFNQYLIYCGFKNSGKKLKRVRMVIDTQKSRFEISPMLYSLCDFMFSDEHVFEDVAVSTSIASEYDSATTSSTQSFVVQLNDKRSDRIDKYRKRISEIDYKLGSSSKRPRDDTEELEKLFLQKKISSLNSKKLEVFTYNRKQESNVFYNICFRPILNNDDKWKTIIEFGLSNNAPMGTEISSLDIKTLEAMKPGQRKKLLIKVLEIIYPIVNKDAKRNPTLPYMLKFFGGVKEIQGFSESIFTGVTVKDSTFKIFETWKRIPGNKGSKLSYEEFVKHNQAFINTEFSRRTEVLKRFLKYCNKFGIQMSDISIETPVIIPKIIKWLDYDKKDLDDMNKLVENGDVKFSFEGISDVIKNDKVDEHKPYVLFLYKTIGDLAQVLECSMMSLNSEYTNSTIPIFVTFDRICGFISSLFNRTIIEMNVKDETPLMNLRTFTYKSDGDYIRRFNRLNVTEDQNKKLKLIGN